MSTYDKTQPDFWYNVEENDMIILKDPETLKESMEDGEGAKGVTYTVTRAPRQIEIDEGWEYLLIDLSSPDKTDVILVVVITDNDVELKSMFNDYNVLKPQTREDLVDNEEFWIFEEPEDPEAFDTDLLEFANVIEFDDCDYQMKDTGEATGSLDGEELQAVIAEYELTASELDNPPNTELLIFQQGEREGGFVTLLFGREILNRYVEHFSDNQ